MKWTKTRLKKFINRGGEILILGAVSRPDTKPSLHRDHFRNFSENMRSANSINASNVDAFCNEYYSKWVTSYITPDYYSSSYYLNLETYKERKANALDSKNDE